MALEESTTPPCTLPPPGWHCTRPPGHSGPCAAVPEKRCDRMVLGCRCTLHYAHTGPCDAIGTPNEPKAVPRTPEPIVAASRYGGWAVDEFIAAMGLGFRLGNVVKYISRAGKKDNATVLDDLRKARVYLDRHITQLEKGEP